MCIYIMYILYIYTIIHIHIYVYMSSDRLNSLAITRNCDPEDAQKMDPFGSGSFQWSFLRYPPKKRYAEKSLAFRNAGYTVYLLPKLSNHPNISGE